MEENMREWESLVERYPILTETRRENSQESVNNQASTTDSFSVNSLQPIPPSYDQVPDIHVPGIFGVERREINKKLISFCLVVNETNETNEPMEISDTQGANKTDTK
jgi:hypothetical protein